MSDAIRYTQADGIAEVVLDDGKVNAMDAAFFDGLNAALDRAERDVARALVLTGRAGFLSPGLNVKLLPTLPPAEYGRTLVSFGHTLLRRSPPWPRSRGTPWRAARCWHSRATIASSPMRRSAST